MFLTGAVRKLQGNDLIYYIPQHLSQWSDNLLANNSVDVFWGSCSPPDERGYVSLGLSDTYETQILHRAKFVVLEINPAMPRTYGSTVVHQNSVHFFIHSDNTLPSIAPEKGEEIDETIAKLVCELIEDGSTLQLGIGGIPNSVAKFLKDKKNLGIHTEMINDAMVDLIESGAVNGSMKKIWPRKVVGAFALGTERLYRFLDQNLGVEIQPAKVVNNPIKIGLNHRMTSINTCVEIDITGQVCSESLGHYELSGVGGAFETHYGAQLSEGGRGILALRSTTRTGQSKIVFELQPGAKVSISRNDVDTVVTEYGYFRLRGKSVRERALGLIQLAQPEFREKLEFNARKYNYI
jgi:acyl-CoA hydrolase